jgi:hypothetical protein
VYSGGLVYEYSEEGSNYGLVKINGNDIEEKPDYQALKTAFAKTPSPDGDGGYNKTGGASGCPAPDAPNWDVTNDALPSIPEPAKQYMTKGAGKGPGFAGSGSQDKGTASTGTATPGSGSATGAAATGSASGSKGAAAGLRIPEMTMAPLYCGAVMLFSTFFGADSCRSGPVSCLVCSFADTSLLGINP